MKEPILPVIEEFADLLEALNKATDELDLIDKRMQVLKYNGFSESSKEYQALTIDFNYSFKRWNIAAAYLNKYLDEHLNESEG